MFSDSQSLQGPSSKTGSRRAALIVVAGLVAALLGLAAPGTSVAQTESHTVTYSGTVTAPSGASVANVVVTVAASCWWGCPEDPTALPDDGPARPRPRDPLVFLGETGVDSSGRWSVTISDPEGDYPTLVVWDRDANLAPRFLTGSDHRELWGWESLSGIEVELEAGGRVSGRFHNPAGGPLPDTDYVLDASLVLDVNLDTGEFISPAVAPGERTLGWIFPPFNDLLPNARATQVEVVAGRTTNAGIIDVNPATHGAIRGKVTDSSGRGIGGITVTGRGPEPYGDNPLWTVHGTPYDYGEFEFWVTTDADGTYETSTRLMPDSGWEVTFRDPTGEYAASHRKGTAIAAGGDHTCALNTDGTIACWGNNRDGQGDAPDGQYTAITAGDEHSCALNTDGTIACWGYNGNGRTDAPSGQYTAITAGGVHSCALRTDGAIVCWGRNSSGETDAPPGISAGSRFIGIAAGGNHSCALNADGTIACWGRNSNGQSDAPNGQYTAIAAGYAHSCALSTNDTIVCWGATHSDQTQAPDGQYTAISAGADHTCALSTNDTIVCWGATHSDQTQAPDGQYTAISAGGSHSCGITATSIIICWGANWYGQADASGSLNSVGVVVMSGETVTLDFQMVSAFAPDAEEDVEDDADASIAARCFASHKFGAEPVDVAKTADRQTVLAQLSWGYHDAIGCYLTLDEAATTALRAANT